jgi:branched-chain amino acid transport system permease protein
MNHLLDGLLLGGLYAGAALGLTLVFGVMRLVNLAHGEILVGAAYLSVVVTSRLGLDPLVALVIVAPALFVVAYPLQRWVLGPLIPHGLEGPLVATFGLSIVAQTLFVLGFGGNPKALDAPYTLTGTSLGGTTVRTIFVIALVAGLALVTLTHLGLTRSRFGKALRAAAEDPAAAASVGIDVTRVYALTFALAAALSAVGGTLIGLAFSVTPTAGLAWLLRAFTVIVLGGMGSIWGSFLGGVGVGIAEELGAAAVGPSYRDLVVFSLLVLVLVLRPQGLLGKRSG